MTQGDNMTFDQYLQHRLKLAGAQERPDRIEARLLVLTKLPKRDAAQEKEYAVLVKAARAKFKAQELERKAKASLEKRDDEARKADTHTKILIGVAAIEIARKNDALRNLLLAKTEKMPSARVELIKQLLGLGETEATAEAATGAASGA